MSKNKEKEKVTVKAQLFSLLHKGSEEVELDSKVFNGRISRGSVYRAVHNHLANARAGTASTKTRSDVRGSGRKPWRQKGTGRARVGSIRTPIWYHGGVVFGPHPREFNYSLPKKIKNLALRSALNDRAMNNDLIVLDNLALSDAKTATFMKLYKKFKLKEKALIVIDCPNENIIKATRNIPFVNVVLAAQLNAYEIMRHPKLLVTVDALKVISKRIH